jgi:hypothetical protein
MEKEVLKNRETSRATRGEAASVTAMDAVMEISPRRN